MSAQQTFLQPGHGYVALLVIPMTFVHLWAGMKVGKARKQYNIPYPQVRS